MYIYTHTFFVILTLLFNFKNIGFVEVVISLNVVYIIGNEIQSQLFLLKCELVVCEYFLC